MVRLGIVHVGAGINATLWELSVMVVSTPNHKSTSKHK